MKVSISARIAATEIFWRWSFRVEVDYQIVVETGQSGIDSNVILCIYGEETATANLALRTIPGSSEGKFARNSRLKFDLKTTDVGKVGDSLKEHENVFLFRLRRSILVTMEPVKVNSGSWNRFRFTRTMSITCNWSRLTSWQREFSPFRFKADRWLGKENNTAYIDLMPGEEKKGNAGHLCIGHQCFFLQIKRCILSRSSLARTSMLELILGCSLLSLATRLKPNKSHCLEPSKELTRCSNQEEPMYLKCNWKMWAM